MWNSSQTITYGETRGQQGFPQNSGQQGPSSSSEQQPDLPRFGTAPELNTNSNARMSNQRPQQQVNNPADGNAGGVGMSQVGGSSSSSSVPPGASVPQHDSRGAPTQQTGAGNPQQQQQSLQALREQQQQPSIISQLTPAEWRGWTMEQDGGGRLFFYHAQSETSEWEMPADLEGALGKWEFLQSENFWYCELLLTWRVLSAFRLALGIRLVAADVVQYNIINLPQQ